MSPDDAEGHAAGDGTADAEAEVYHLDDISFEGPNLDIGSPPPGLPYEEVEDWISAEILTANGIALTEKALVEALESQSNVILSAAAHASWSVPTAVPALRSLVDGPDDYAGVEAANALARRGEPDAQGLLRTFLSRPAGPYLSPILAAGYLAQLGDPSGFGVVREGLQTEFISSRMLACKQLYFFLPFQDHLDVLGLFERALTDDDPAIRDQALGELRLSSLPEAAKLVERYGGR